MGFWDQLDSDSADRRRSRIRPRPKPPSAGETTRERTETFRTVQMENDLHDFEKQGTPVPTWDVRGINHGHPEWENDPDLLAGFELAKRLDFDAMGKLGDALTNGNLLAAVLLGDFFSSIFCIQIQWRPYRIGSDQYLDALIKMILSCYLLVLGQEAFTEKVAERIQFVRNYCIGEEDFMELAAECMEKIKQLCAEHPEEIFKIFSKSL